MAKIGKYYLAAASLGGLRSFTYEASGQVATDDRAGQIYAYTNNNRGRPVLVTKDGVQVAAYIYDDDEQRVVKSLPDGTLIHYAYDSEGRLISETNGATGDTIREYLWLGLTPIAVIANDNAPCAEQTEIDRLTPLIAAQLALNETRQAALDTFDGKIAVRQDRIDRLTAQNLMRQTAITTRQGKIANLEALITTREGQIAGRQADIITAEARVVIAQDKVAHYENLLAAADPTDTARIALLTQRRDNWAANLALYQDRIVRYQGYITGWQANIADYQSRIAVHNTRIDTITANIAANDVRIADQQGKIADIEARQAVIATRLAANIIRIAAWQAQLDTLQTQCAAAGGTGSGTPTLSYLHTDHLGKPQFATDSAGTVIWDAGAGVTPFGDGINLAAAFAQNIQFPGQYYDPETALSHNHHRTYDPTH